jgi:hypothetical protein
MEVSMKKLILGSTFLAVLLAAFSFDMNAMAYLPKGPGPSIQPGIVMQRNNGSNGPNLISDSAKPTLKMDQPTGMVQVDFYDVVEHVYQIESSTYIKNQMHLLGVLLKSFKQDHPKLYRSYFVVEQKSIVGGDSAALPPTA